MTTLLVLFRILISLGKIIYDDPTDAEYIKLDYNISRDKWLDLNKRRRIRKGEYKFKVTRENLVKETTGKIGQIYLRQPIQSGLGAKNDSKGRLVYDYLAQNFSQKQGEEMIEIKSINVKDLKRIKENKFKNVRVTRAGFEPSPANSHFLGSILMSGFFSSFLSSDQPSNMFDLTLRESEWGIKVGTPAFVYGGLVVDKAKNDVYIDSVIGVFKSRDDFLKFLKSNLDSYDAILTMFIASLVIMGGYGVYKVYKRRRVMR